MPIKTAHLRYAVCRCCLYVKNANCYDLCASQSFFLKKLLHIVWQLFCLCGLCIIWWCHHIACIQFNLKRTVIFCTKFFEVVNRSRANPYQSRASSYQLAIGWGIWFFKFETALLELLKNADSEVVTANRFCTKELPMNQISALPNPLKILFQEYNQGQIESVGFCSFKEILEAIRLMDADERRELTRALFA